MIKKNEKGIVLVTVVITIMVLSLIISGLFVLGSSSVRSTGYWKNRDECLELAQSSLEKAKWDIYTKLRDYYTGKDRLPYLVEQWFGAHTDTSLGLGGVAYIYNFPKDAKFYYKLGGVPSSSCPWKNGTYSVSIGDPIESDGGGSYDVVISVTAKLNGKTRKIQERVSYGLESSPVFKYAIFTNGDYKIQGGYTIFGNVGMNGNCEINNNGTKSPDFYGHVVASENKALGHVGSVKLGSGVSRDSITNEAYEKIRFFSPALRIARPAATKDKNHEFLYYDQESSAKLDKQYEPEVEMPDLSNIEAYKKLADYRQSKLEVWNEATNSYKEVTTDGTYDGPGPDGIKGTADDGVLVIVGTEEHPFKITGPVVVDKDIIIKGTYIGQGTLYSGRNVHIIGNVKANSPASWSNTDANGTVNKGGDDMLALAAGGSLVYGNTTKLYSSVTEKNEAKSWSRWGKLPGIKERLQTSNGGKYLTEDGGYKPGLEDVKHSSSWGGIREVGRYNGRIYGMGKRANSDLAAGDKLILYDKAGQPARTVTVRAVTSAYVLINEPTSMGPRVYYGSCKKITKTPRKYYEPSVSDEFFESLQERDTRDREANPTGFKLVTRIDAICYTNNLRMGMTGTGTIFNGCLVQHHVASISENAKIIWDRRLLGEARKYIGLPRSLKRGPERVYWREVQ